MTELTEGKHTGGFILSEADGRRSRDEVTVTVPVATTYSPGLVLGKLTATGLYVPYDNAGSDGEEAAAGILYGELVNADATYPADMQATIINQDAEVRKADLQWDAGQDDAAKTAAYADLLALGIKVRD